VSQALRGERFVLDVESGELLVLDGDADALWERLSAGDSIADAVAQIEGASVDEAVELASELVRLGLLELCAGSPPLDRAAASVRSQRSACDRGRIAVLYHRTSWPSWYSVAHIVLSQCAALSQRGFSVRLIAPIGCPRPALDDAIEFDPSLPDVDALRDGEGALESAAGALADRLEVALAGCELVLTHDLVLLDQNLAYNLAIRSLASRAPIRWLHWLHSTPRLRPAAPPPLPEGLIFRPIARSTYVCVSPQHRLGAAQMLAIAEERVEVVANSRLEGFFGDPLLWAIAERRGLLDASIVAVFPTRLNRVAKQAEDALYIMRSLKALGHTIRLVFATPDGDTDAERTRIMQLRWLAEAIGLARDDLVFVADEDASLRKDCPNTLVRDLLLLGNLFIHPSAAEAHSLTLLEAAAMKNLCVLNADVPSFRDVAGDDAVWIHCGALGGEGIDDARIERALERHVRGDAPRNEDALIERLIVLYGVSPDARGFYPLHARYYSEYRAPFDACAAAITARLAASPALALQQRVRQRYSAARVVQTELLPLIRAALEEAREADTEDLRAHAGVQ
jgi:glycosyltransferase involved in cell wall biosynthesis